MMAPEGKYKHILLDGIIPVTYNFGFESHSMAFILNTSNMPYIQLKYIQNVC